MSRNALLIMTLYVVVMGVSIGLLLPDTIAWIIAAMGFMGLVQLYSYFTKQDQQENQ